METVNLCGRAGDDAFLGFWNAIRASFLPIELRRLGTGAFRSEFRRSVAEGVSFTRIACDPVLVHCGARDAVALPRSEYQLRVQLAGKSAFSQHGREVVLEAGDFTLLDPSAPFSIANRFGPLKSLNVGIARAYLDARLRDVQPFCAVRYSGTSGPGRLAINLLTALSEEVAALTKTELEEAVRAAVALLVPELRRRRECSPGRARLDPAGLRREIEGYIDANFADPSLSPRRIAEAHNVSVRYLFKLFEPSPASLAELIRQRRLAQCYEDLHDPELRAETILSIAFASGFSDAAHFSRSFRRQFGCSPRSVRTKTDPSDR